MRARALAEIQTAGFSGAVFKKFSMISDAIEFVITKTTPSQIALESKDEVPVVAVSDKHKGYLCCFQMCTTCSRFELI